MLQLMMAMKPLAGGGGGGPGPGSGAVPFGYAKASTGTATALSTYTLPLTGLTAWGGGAGGAAQAGDLCLVWSGWADTADIVPGVDSTASPGFTLLTELFQADTRAANAALHWKILTSTDIATGTITVKGANNTGKGGAAFLIILRNPTASPIAQSVLTAQAPDGDTWNPPALTTAKASSVVLMFGAATRAANDTSVGQVGTGASPISAGSDNIFGSGTARNFQVGVAYSLGNAAGTVVDQAARTSTPNTASDSWVAATVEVF